MESHVLDIERRIELSPRELTHGGEREIEVERIVPCACNVTRGYRAAPGCGGCDGGFTHRTETLRVHVPAGVAVGMKLRLRGKGHESVGGGAGDVFVEVQAIRPPREEAPPPPRRQRPWTRAHSAVLGLLVALVASGVTLSFVSKKPGLGKPCTRGTDCASGQCLSLFERPTVDLGLGPGTERFELPMLNARGAVCTTSCNDDADCPSSMRCAPVEQSPAYSHLALPRISLDFKPDALACSPR